MPSETLTNFTYDDLLQMPDDGRRYEIIDGELIVMRGDGPDFHALMRRDACRSDGKVGQMATAMPATFVAFDLLYHRHKSIVRLPLAERRVYSNTISPDWSAFSFLVGIAGASTAFVGVGIAAANFGRGGGASRTGASGARGATGVTV